MAETVVFRIASANTSELNRPRHNVSQNLGTHVQPITVTVVLLFRSK